MDNKLLYTHVEFELHESRNMMRIHSLLHLIAEGHEDGFLLRLLNMQIMDNPLRHRRQRLHDIP
jgi:hypothetical protein